MKTSFATWIASAPWRGRFLAVAAGIAAALAQPPWGCLPGLLGYGLLFLVVDRSPGPRTAFARGWQAGLGYFLLSLFWLAEPFQVDAEHQGWMAPLAVGLTSAFMALFWGSAAAVYRALAGRTPLRALLFAALLALAEWLRGHILTGFPWDPPGSLWAAGGAVSQIASVVGIWGLTWITLAIAASLFTAREGRSGLGLAIVAVAALIGLYAYGAHRLAQPAPPDAGPLLRVVQADVRQQSKYDPAAFASIVSRYVSLTERPAARRPDVVIWSEGAIPAAVDDYLAPGAWTRDLILAAVQPGQQLILGAYRFGPGPRDKASVYNSLIALRRTADGFAQEGLYDKRHLVPFGEYLPLDKLATRLGIKAMVHVGDGFTPGGPPRSLVVPGLPRFQPLICYEALYSGFTRSAAARTGARAAWILNISNDAWFGHGVGPEQHLNLASYRAIEEGLPMVRVTPTGVSAVIDARGRIVPGERLGEGAFGVIDAPLPGALGPTLFERWGDAGFFLMLIASLSGLVRPARSQPRVSPGTRRAS